MTLPQFVLKCSFEMACFGALPVVLLKIIHIPEHATATRVNGTAITALQKHVKASGIHHFSAN